MKKLLIIATLAISSVTYGGELILKQVGSDSIKEVCVDLLYPENEECFRQYDDMEIDESNPDHVKLMISAEEGLKDWALYSCEKRSGEDPKKLRVEQISDTTFEMRFRATNFGSLGELMVIAWADFKCILP